LIEGILTKKSRYTEFEFIISNYFKFHKNNIIELNKKWYEELPDNLKNEFKTSMNKFESIINLI